MWGDSIGWTYANSAKECFMMSMTEWEENNDFTSGMIRNMKIAITQPSR